MFLVSLASAASPSGTPDLVVTTAELAGTVALLEEHLELDTAARERLAAALVALTAGQVIEVKHHEADLVLTAATVVRLSDLTQVVEPFLANDGDGLPTNHASGLGYVEDYDADNAAEDPALVPVESFVWVVEEADLVERLQAAVSSLENDVRLVDDDKRVTRPLVAVRARATSRGIAAGVYYEGRGAFVLLGTAVPMPRELAALLAAAERAVSA